MNAWKRERHRWVRYGRAGLAGLVLTGLTCCADGERGMQQEPKQVHRAYGSGRWFPGSANGLKRTVDGFIDTAAPPATTGRVVSALAPHAGYVYSGGVAGFTFRAIRDAAARGQAPDTVVILGFSHSASFRGVALLDGDAIETPLGTVPLDRRTGRDLAAASDRIMFRSDPHRGEHSAENEVPFVQAALPGTPLVIGIIGDHDPETLKALVDALVNAAASKTLLVVASTDLLHDPDYDRVTAVDHRTLKHITALDDKALAKSWSYEQQVCCGIGPVLAAMHFARRQGCREGTLLQYRNSGDDHPESRGNWVVGYGAVIFTVAE